MRISSFSRLPTLSIFILLCGCDKATPVLDDQKDKSTSRQETALDVRELNSLKTVKVIDPVSTQKQQSSSEVEPVTGAPVPESSIPTERKVTLQTPATRSAARVTAMQEFEALKASQSD